MEGKGNGFEECENGARVIEIVLFEKVRSETRSGREGENERERERERVGEEEKKPRMIETSKELQENERKKAVVFAGGRVVVSPTLPPPCTIPFIPVRFEFRVEILAARARRKRGKERKMAISAGSAPPPPLFHSGFRGASWKRRNNVIDLPIENFSFEKIALLRFRDHFFLPARSFVVEGVDFFLSGVGLGWRPRGGDPSKGIQRDGVSEVEAGFN